MAKSDRRNGTQHVDPLTRVREHIPADRLTAVCTLLSGQTLRKKDAIDLVKKHLGTTYGNGVTTLPLMEAYALVTHAIKHSDFTLVEA